MRRLRLTIAAALLVALVLPSLASAAEVEYMSPPEYAGEGTITWPDGTKTKHHTMAMLEDYNGSSSGYLTTKLTYQNNGNVVPPLHETASMVQTDAAYSEVVIGSAGRSYNYTGGFATIPSTGGVFINAPAGSPVRLSGNPWLYGFSVPSGLPGYDLNSYKSLAAKPNGQEAHIEIIRAVVPASSGSQWYCREVVFISDCSHVFIFRASSTSPVWIPPSLDNTMYGSVSGSAFFTPAFRFYQPSGELYPSYAQSFGVFYAQNAKQWVASASLSGAEALRVYNQIPKLTTEPWGNGVDDPTGGNGDVDPSVEASGAISSWSRITDAFSQWQEIPFLSVFIHWVGWDDEE